jgi:dipeptidase D
LFTEEYDGIEPNLQLQAEKTGLPSGIFPEEVQDDIINAIYAAPNGVFRHLPKMKEVIETSNNLAIVKTDSDKVVVKCLVRSSIESKKYELCSMLESVFSLAGAKIEFLGGYPGWEPNVDSAILKIAMDSYAEMFGSFPELKVIHAGLECGIIGAAYPTLDMISFGPTICHPHSPDEKVNIPSVLRFWEFLKILLANIPS